MHRATPHCPLGASEWRGARCSLVKTGRLQPARLSLPHSVCPMRPGTSQFRPTGPGERKEERPRARGQMSEFLFPRVLLIMLVRKRKRAQTFAFTLFQISTRSLFPLPVSEKISHLENHGVVQAWTLHLESPSFQWLHVHTYQPCDPGQMALSPVPQFPY